MLLSHAANIQSDGEELEIVDLLLYASMSSASVSLFVNSAEGLKKFTTQEYLSLCCPSVEWEDLAPGTNPSDVGSWAFLLTACITTNRMRTFCAWTIGCRSGPWKTRVCCWRLLKNHATNSCCGRSRSDTRFFQTIQIGMCD